MVVKGEEVRVEEKKKRLALKEDVVTVVGVCVCVRERMGVVGCWWENWMEGQAQQSQSSCSCVFVAALCPFPCTHRKFACVTNGAREKEELVWKELVRQEWASAQSGGR